jgi:hypothetical protein
MLEWSYAFDSWFGRREVGETLARGAGRVALQKAATPDQLNQAPLKMLAWASPPAGG